MGRTGQSSLYPRFFKLRTLSGFFEKSLSTTGCTDTFTMRRPTRSCSNSMFSRILLQRMFPKPADSFSKLTSQSSPHLILKPKNIGCWRWMQLSMLKHWNLRKEHKPNGSVGNSIKRFLTDKPRGASPLTLCHFCHSLLRVRTIGYLGGDGEWWIEERGECSAGYRITEM